MWPGVSTLRGRSGASYEVDSEIATLGDRSGASSSVGADVASDIA